MANFIVVVDPNPERRSHFTQTVQPLLPPVEGLITNSCNMGDFQAIWAANPQAPVHCAVEEDNATVIWGEAIIASESTRIDASGLKTLWKESDYEKFPSFDGFYAAVAYHSQFGIAVGADLLGLFPVYYYTHNDVVLIGSSPELFRYHPLFKPELNQVGLVGLLLTNGLFEGQTLWKNVQRLGAGHLLIWQPGNSPTEIKQYQIPVSTQNHPYAALSFSDGVDILDRAFDQAVTRHAPKGQQYTLLLSGGLDSRLIGGYLRDYNVDTVALTLGIPTDIERQCASSVARCLGLKHYFANVPLKQYPHYADVLVKWEHLANGGNCIMDWGVQAHLGNLPPRIVSGYVIHLLLSGTQSFDGFFARRINNPALSPQLLERLLRKDVFGDLVQQTIDRIRTVYESYSDEETVRSWWFELYHRQRFHTGCAGWQLCFGAWPILPILDWKLLETVALLPSHFMDDRRGQKQVLRNRFPDLAKLPLDRNDYNIDPLILNKSLERWPRLFRLQRKLQRKWEKVQRDIGFERRYYYRTYDINNAGWKAVRQQAEPYRERVQHLFNLDVLNELLPPPDVSIPRGSDPIPQSSGIKLLIGLLLWSRENL